MAKETKNTKKTGRGGKPLRIMEVCGTHTAAIYRSGLRSILPDDVKLISGPGCPVCVTPPSYIDKCIEIAESPKHILLCFGDMLKVPGGAERYTLSELGASGGNVRMVYSPFEAVKAAQGFPEKTIVVAAVGFETTAPAYALLLEEAEQKGLRNIKLITSLKSAIAAIEWICASGEDVDAFLCPGHVSTITGSEVYEPIAEKYGKPFVIAGFEDEHVAAAVNELLRTFLLTGRTQKEPSPLCPQKEPSPLCPSREGHKKNRPHCVLNLYPEAVRREGNPRAKALIDKYFDTDETVWRGLGAVPASGYFLKPEYAERDIDWGERQTDASENERMPEGCGCGDVVLGRKDPCECALFGKDCTPLQPVGPCMVSSEGACGIAFRNL